MFTHGLTMVNPVSTVSKPFDYVRSPERALCEVNLVIPVTCEYAQASEASDYARILETQRYIL